MVACSRTALTSPSRCAKGLACIGPSGGHATCRSSTRHRISADASGAPCISTFTILASNTAALFASQVLFAFMRGAGHWIPDTCNIGNRGGDPTAEQRQAFHNAAVEAMHTLLGAAPRLDKKVNAQGVEQFILYRE